MAGERPLRSAVNVAGPPLMPTRPMRHCAARQPLDEDDGIAQQQRRVDASRRRVRGARAPSERGCKRGCARRRPRASHAKSSPDAEATNAAVARPARTATARGPPAAHFGRRPHGALRPEHDRRSRGRRPGTEIQRHDHRRALRLQPVRGGRRHQIEDVVVGGGDRHVVGGDRQRQHHAAQRGRRGAAASRRTAAGGES